MTIRWGAGAAAPHGPGLAFARGLGLALASVTVIVDSTSLPRKDDQS